MLILFKPKITTMKAKIIFFLMISIIIFSCTQSQTEDTQEKISPIEGAWENVYFKWTDPDSTFVEYPGNVTECNSSWFISGNKSLF